MNISIKSKKLEKIVVFSAISLFLIVVSPLTAHAEQSTKLSLLNPANLFQSCANTSTGNTYCWNNKLNNESPASSDIAEQVNVKAHHSTSSLQRIAAATLGLVLELTTSQSFNEFGVN